MKETFRVKVSHSLGGVAGDFHPQTPWYLLIAKNQLFQATTLDVLRNWFFFFKSETLEMTIEIKKTP